MRKSNKLLIFVACLVLLTALVIGLVACDPTPSQHQHTAVDEWSSDANGHWHACVEDDDAKLDSAEHTFGEWLIDSDNKHYKKCSTCQYETAHEAHNLTINADKTKFTCECGYSEDHSHVLGALVSDGADGHHQACTTEGCGYVTEKSNHELSINADKTAFECECGYSEAHTHKLSSPINDGEDGHHQACETQGCGYVTPTGNHSLQINSDYTKYECECGYSEDHTHTLVINEDKTKFTCTCGYSENHTHTLGELTPDGATGHYKECQTQGCGYRETNTHTLTINDDKTAFECECGYSEAHTHKLGSPINDGEDGHHQACETQGCGYVTENSDHELSINADKTAFECECGYSEAHSHTFGALVNDGADGHHKDCQTDGCGYRASDEHTLKINAEKTAFECECGYSEAHSHTLGELKSDGKEGHHQECTTEGCGYIGEKSSHDLKINEGKTAFECECGYSEAHEHDLGEEYISDGATGHHQACQTEGCGYETTPGAHDLHYVEDEGKNTHHAMCNNCDYVGEGVAHNPGAEASMVDENEHAFKCVDCNADVKEAHRKKTVADEDGAKHHIECEVCSYKSASTEHTSDNKYHTGDGKHWYECTECNARMDEAEHTQQGDIQSDEKGHFYLCVCGEEVNRQEHTPGEEWQQDEEAGKHFKLCTECNARVQEGAHVEKFVRDSATKHHGACETCGKVTTASTAHDAFAEGMSFTKAATSSYHYYTCPSCEGEAQASHTYGPYENVENTQHKRTCTACKYENIAKHSTLNSSGACTDHGDDGHTYICSTCKLEVLVAHTYTWKQSDNNTKHYQECTFSKCKHQTEAVAHTVPDTVSKITGTTKAYLDAASKYHKFTCPVCSKTDAQIEHTWAHDDGSNIDYCSVCDYSRWTLELTGEYYTITGYYSDTQTIEELTLPTTFKGTPIKALGGTNANKNTQSYTVFYYYGSSKIEPCQITKLVIPEGYSTLGAAALNNAIGSLYLPSSLETIAQNAFSSAGGSSYLKTNITNVYFEDFEGWLFGTSEFGVTSANQTPFVKTGSVKDHTNVFAKQDDGYTQITNLVLDENCDYIGPYALYNANITSITFDFTNLSTITVGNNAFQNAPIDKVYVSSIDDYASKIDYEGTTNVFSTGASLYVKGTEEPVTELAFGPTVTTLAPIAFKGATFKKLTLTDALQDISTALQGINGLEEIHVSNLKTLITLTNSENVNNSLSLWKASPKAKLYIADVETKEITIDDEALSSIEEGGTLSDVFAGCGTIEGVTFTNTKNITLYYTFYWPSSTKSESVLAKVDLGNHITKLDSALTYCKNLTGEFRVPDSVTYISDFIGCTGLTVIYLPATLTNYDGAFRSCTAKIVFAKDAKPETGRFGSSGGNYLGTEVVLPASFDSLMVDSVFMFADAPNIKVIYFGGDEATWAKMVEGIQNSAAQAQYDAFREKYKQMPVRYLKETYPGDDLAATGNYWYYTEDGNTAIWMKGNEEKNGKYLMFEQSTYYVNIDDVKTPLTLTPFIGEATFSTEAAEGFEVTPEGVVSANKAGKYTVKATLKDNDGIYVELTVFAYTGTYFIAGKLGGEDISDKTDAYTFSTDAEHEEYSLNVALKAGDSFKLYAKGIEGALAKTSFKAEGSLGDEFITVGDDGTITVKKDASVKITLTVTDGNNYQFVITANADITIAIEGRYEHHDAGVIVSTVIAMPSEGTTTVQLTLTYANLNAKQSVTAKNIFSYTNICFSVTLADGTKVTYDGTQSDKIAMSGTKYSSSSSSSSSKSKWIDESTNKGELWYNGTISSSNKFTFTLTINSEGKITACVIA